MNKILLLGLFLFSNATNCKTNVTLLEIQEASNKGFNTYIRCNLDLSSVTRVEQRRGEEKSIMYEYNRYVKAGLQELRVETLIHLKDEKISLGPTTVFALNGNICRGIVYGGTEPLELSELLRYKIYQIDERYVDYTGESLFSFVHSPWQNLSLNRRSDSNLAPVNFTSLASGRLEIVFQEDLVRITTESTEETTSYEFDVSKSFSLTSRKSSYKNRPESEAYSIAKYREFNLYGESVYLPAERITSTQSSFDGVKVARTTERKIFKVQPVEKPLLPYGLTFLPDIDLVQIIKAMAEVSPEIDSELKKLADNEASKPQGSRRVLGLP